MINAKKAGLFGGTFNPPHIGHYVLASEVMKQFKLDKVIFIPSFLPPHKDIKTVIDANHREKMTELLVSENPGFMASNYEVQKKTVSYSIDTVRHFMSEFPGREFFFLTGSDAFFHIETWKEYRELLKLIKFIVFYRENVTRDMIIKKHPGVNFLWADTKPIKISSSEIRARLRRNENCREDLGEKVWEYVHEHGLYKAY